MPSAFFLAGLITRWLALGGQNVRGWFMSSGGRLWMTGCLFVVGLAVIILIIAYLMNGGGRAINRSVPPYNQGTAFVNQGENDKAIADSNEAIRLNPTDALAYADRGGAYSNKGDNDQAIANCSEAIEHDPKCVFAYLVRGLAYEQKGDLDRAKADRTRAAEINPAAGKR